MDKTLNSRGEAGERLRDYRGAGASTATGLVQTPRPRDAQRGVVVIEISSFRFAFISSMILFVSASFSERTSGDSFNQRRSDSASFMHSAACLKLTDFAILRVGGARSTPGILPSAPVSVNSEGAPLVSHSLRRS